MLANGGVLSCFHRNLIFVFTLVSGDFQRWIRGCLHRGSVVSTPRQVVRTSVGSAAALWELPSVWGGAALLEYGDGSQSES